MLADTKPPPNKLALNALTTTGVGEHTCPTCDGTREVLTGNPNSPNAILATCPDCDDYDPTDVDPYDI